MIYNLYNYIKTQLTDLSLIVNGWEKDSPEESITMILRVGDPDHYDIRQESAVQFLSRAMDSNIALSNINEVYSLLKNRFGLVLPEVTVGETVFPEIKTYQISPMQSPGYIGSDGANLEMWSFNIMIVTAI